METPAYYEEAAINPPSVPEELDIGIEDVHRGKPLAEVGSGDIHYRLRNVGACCGDGSEVVVDMGNKPAHLGADPCPLDFCCCCGGGGQAGILEDMS